MQAVITLLEQLGACPHCGSLPVNIGLECEATEKEVTDRGLTIVKKATLKGYRLTCANWHFWGKSA